MNPDEFLEEISRYDFYQDRFPEKINPYVNNFLLSSREAISKEKPALLNVLIVSPPTKWISRAESLNFYSFAKFKRPYQVIKVLSEILTPVYLELDILPVIRPFQYEYAYYFGKFYEREYYEIRSSGLLVYHSKK